MDIDATTTPGGLLLPRIALTGTTNVSPLANHVAGMAVYNTATMGDVTPHYYYNDGGKWVRLAAASVPSDDWTLTGNSGTVSGTNFLGTIDQESLRFRTRNFESFEITDGNNSNNGGGGRLHAFFNGTASSPTYSWKANSSTGMFQQSANVLGFSTNGSERIRIPDANQVHAMSDGTVAFPFYSWSSDSDTGMYRIGNNTLGFSTNGNERVRVSGIGNVSIGTLADASQKLEVTGNLRLNGAFMPNKIPGGTDKILLSQGAVIAPVWGPGFLNTTQISNIGKFYVGPITINRGTLILTVTNPNMTFDTSLAYNFIGSFALGPNYATELSILVESRNGTVVFHIKNDSIYNLINFQIVYTAFYH